MRHFLEEEEEEEGAGVMGSLSEDSSPAKRDSVEEEGRKEGGLVVFIREETYIEGEIDRGRRRQTDKRETYRQK